MHVFLKAPCRLGRRMFSCTCILDVKRSANTYAREMKGRASQIHALPLECAIDTKYDSCTLYPTCRVAFIKQVFPRFFSPVFMIL